MQRLRHTTTGRVSPDGCARDVLAAVPAVMRFIKHQMRRHGQAELTVPQFRALVVLSHQGPASLSVLADHLGLSLPAASRMVELLVKRGLMDRQAQTDDRRRVSLSLTRRGRQTFAKARAATQVALGQSLSTLSLPQLAQISAAMRVLNRVFAPGNCRPHPEN